MRVSGSVGVPQNAGQPGSQPPTAQSLAGIMNKQGIADNDCGRCIGRDITGHWPSADAVAQTGGPVSALEGGR